MQAGLVNSSEAAHALEQPGLTPALAVGLTAYSLILVAALTFVLHRPTRRLACLRLTTLVAGFAFARILSTSLLAPSSLAARVVHAWVNGAAHILFYLAFGICLGRALDGIIDTERTSKYAEQTLRVGAVLWPLLAIAATIAEVVASIHHEGDVARLHAAGIFIDSPAGSGAMAAARAAQALVATVSALMACALIGFVVRLVLLHRRVHVAWGTRAFLLLGAACAAGATALLRCVLLLMPPCWIVGASPFWPLVSPGCLRSVLHEQLYVVWLPELLPLLSGVAVPVAFAARQRRKREDFQLIGGAATADGAAATTKLNKLRTKELAGSRASIMIDSGLPLGDGSPRTPRSVKRGSTKASLLLPSRAGSVVANGASDAPPAPPAPAAPPAKDGLTRARSLRWRPASAKSRASEHASADAGGLTCDCKEYTFLNTSGQAQQVRESLTESSCTWSVPAEYVELHRAAVRAHIGALKEAIIELGKSADLGEEAVRRMAQGQQFSSSGDGGKGGGGAFDEAAGVAHEMLRDVAAARRCDPMTWLQVLHHSYLGFHNSLAEPIELYAVGAAAPKLRELCAGLSFKPSKAKNEPLLRFVATNCHVQRLSLPAAAAAASSRGGRRPTFYGGSSKSGRATDGNADGGGEVVLQMGPPDGDGATAASSSAPVAPRVAYETVTVGAPAAHARKFKGGGVFQLSQKLDRCDKAISQAIADGHAERRRHMVQKRQWLLYQRSQRLGICVCQALVPLASAVQRMVAAATAAGADGGRLRIWQHCGLIVGWESLLSTQGKEMGMLGDAWGAILALRDLRVYFVADTTGAAASRVTVRRASELLDGARAATTSGGGAAEPAQLPEAPELPEVVLQFALPPAEFERLPLALQRRPLPLLVCLFSQGVNEQQTLANATGSTALQEEINRQSLTWLEGYVERLAEVKLGGAKANPHAALKVGGVTYSPMVSEEELAAMGDAEREVMELRLLVAEVASIIESPPARNKGGIKKKDTRVLKLTAQAIRSAGGGRIVSCKSAKDRTSMSVTAEQVALLRRRHELPETEAQPLLDAMRRDGVRMQNTFKNVGKAGYAFNALQRLLLPASLRAPKDTTVSGLEA